MGNALNTILNIFYRSEWDGKTRNNSELQFVVQTPLRTTVVVDTIEKCETAMHQIISDCIRYRAVGFDCEWIGHRSLNKYGKVLVLSICTPQGYCALFRLHKLPEIPKCLSVNFNFTKQIIGFQSTIERVKKLQDFLADETYKKAGISAFPVTHLWNDYGIIVNGSIDLRVKAIYSKEKLQQLLGPRLHRIANHLSNISIHRDLTNFDMTKFADPELSPETIAFAAHDVHGYIEAYKKFFPLEEPTFFQKVFVYVAVVIAFFSFDKAVL